MKNDFSLGIHYSIFRWNFAANEQAVMSKAKALKLLESGGMIVENSKN